MPVKWVENSSRLYKARSTMLWKLDNQNWLLFWRNQIEIHIMLAFPKFLTKFFYFFLQKMLGSYEKI